MKNNRCLRVEGCEIGKRLTTLLPVLVVVSCGESNSAPEPVGTIEPQEIFVTDSFVIEDLGDYFRDPDGDSLAFSGASSDPGLLSVVVNRKTLMGIPQGGRNAATVTTTATDPDGATADQTFPVTVLNRDPETRGEFPSVVLKPQETGTIDLSSLFSDPDGDQLAYRAEADGDLVEVSVSGDTLTILAGTTAGEGDVAVTALDDYGGEVDRRGTVAVVPGLVGIWTGSFVKPPVTIDVKLDLESADEDLSGTLAFKILILVVEGDVMGTFDDPDIEFRATGDIEATFKGKVSGDTMTGTLTWGTPFDLTLTRQGSG